MSNYGNIWIVSLNEKINVIDLTGTKLFPEDYDDLYLNFLELIMISKDNKKGNIIFPPKYDDVLCDKGLCLLKLKDKYGLSKLSSEEVVPIKYDAVKFFKDGYVSVCLGGKCGIIDIKGKVVVPFEYDNILCFIHGFVPAILNNKLVFIDETNKVVYTNIICDGLDLLNEDIVIIESKGKYSLLGMRSKKIISNQYDKIKRFMSDKVMSEEIVEVTLNGKVGVLNENGEKILPIEYTDINSIDDFVIAILKDQAIVFDRAGRLILPNVDKFEREENGLFRVRRGDKFGDEYVDRWGRNCCFVSYFKEGDPI